MKILTWLKSRPTLGKPVPNYTCRAEFVMTGKVLEAAATFSTRHEAQSHADHLIAKFQQSRNTPCLLLKLDNAVIDLSKASAISFVIE